MFKNSFQLSKSLIISPSGNLYGSEQVLIEYLMETQKKFCVYVPENSQLYSQLINEKHNHSIKTFSNLYLLYSILIFKLILTKNRLYINEGGHIRYVKVLARLLPFRKFFVHIRLLEDCSSKRINNLPGNIQIITVSNFLRDNIKRDNVAVIIDPYTLSNTNPISKYESQESNEDKCVKIGIIGRITTSKGLDNLFPILDLFEKERRIVVNLFFFGSFNSNDAWTKLFISKLKKYTWVNHKFLGFVSNKAAIYSDVDLILHLNKVEALGRIIFEAIDFEVPILAFDTGGCGELLKKLELNDLLITTNASWAEYCQSKIIELNSKYPKKEILKAKGIIKVNCNAYQYVSELERIIC